MTDVLELGKKHGVTVLLTTSFMSGKDSLMFTLEELQAFADELTQSLAKQAKEWQETSTNGVLHLKNVKKGIDTIDGAIAAMEVDIEHCKKAAAAGGGEIEYDALSNKQLRDALRECFDDWADFDIGINVDNIEKNYTYFSVTVVHKSMGHEYEFRARVNVRGTVSMKLYDDSDWRAIDKATMFSWMWFETAEPRT